MTERSPLSRGATDRATSAASSGSTLPDHDVARLAYFALYALQHRGQESAGHRGRRPRRLHHHPARAGARQPGLQGARPARAAGDLAIGHVRYSTTGSNEWENSQPVHRSPARRQARARAGPQRQPDQRGRAARRAARQGVEFSSTSDSEIIAALLATHPAERIEDAVADVLPRLKGAFSTVVMTKDRVVAFRDPAGLRPLVARQLGRPLLRGLGVVRVRHHRRRAAARRPARARWSRYRREGLEARKVVEGERAGVLRLRVHLLRAARLAMNGQLLQAARGRMGEILAREAPAPSADLVIAGARLGQRRRARLRPRARAAAGRRLRSRTATSRGRSSSPARSCASTACG